MRSVVDMLSSAAAGELRDAFTQCVLQKAGPRPGRCTHNTYAQQGSRIKLCKRFESCSGMPVTAVGLRRAGPQASLTAFERCRWPVIAAVHGVHPCLSCNRCVCLTGRGCHVGACI